MSWAMINKAFKGWNKESKRGEETFENQIIKTDTCWVWMGAINEQGYGQYRGKRAHRVAFERYHKRKIKEGMCILHSCDSPPCVNPDHLREGSSQENTDDMISKGRASWQKKKSKQPLPAIDENLERRSAVEFT